MQGATTVRRQFRRVQMRERSRKLRGAAQPGGPGGWTVGDHTHGRNRSMRQIESPDSTGMVRKGRQRTTPQNSKFKPDETVMLEFEVEVWVARGSGSGRRPPPGHQRRWLSWRRTGRGSWWTSSGPRGAHGEVEVDSQNNSHTRKSRDEDRRGPRRGRGIHIEQLT